MSKRAYHHGDLRRALLDATLAIVRDKGSAAVTLREVARAVGVSQTAPYRHFPDHVTMLAAAAEEGFRVLRAQLLEVAGPTTGTPETRVIAWAGAYARFAVTQTPYFRLMHGQGSPPKSATAELQAAARDTFQLLFQALGELRRERGLRVDPHELALQVWSIPHGMASLAVEGQTQFLGIPAPEIERVARGAMARFLASLPSPRRVRRPG